MSKESNNSTTEKIESGNELNAESLNKECDAVNSEINEENITSTQIQTLSADDIKKQKKAERHQKWQEAFSWKWAEGTILKGRSNVLFVTFVCIYVILMGIVFFSSPAYGSEELYSNAYTFVYDQPDPVDPYMQMTHALEMGQVYLDIIPSDELLALENPYDPAQRIGVSYIWDFAFYNGKYYSYFGVVPVILVLLPFHLITGKYFSTYYFAFFLGVGVVVSLAFLYRKIIKVFMPDSKPWLYLGGLASILIGSNILFLCARSWFYEIPYNSGLIFVFVSLLFLLQAYEGNKKHKRVYLGLSGLCIGLSVGCRPIYLATLLMHIPYWVKEFKEKGFKNKSLYIDLVVYAVPPMVVGILIAIYNYVRFDSFVQFGTIYQLTVSDISKNSIFDLPKTYEGLLRYLFQPVYVDTKVPFVHLFFKNYTEAASSMYSLPAVGQFALPVVFGLFFYPYYISLSKRTVPKQKRDFYISLFIGSTILTAFVVLISVIGNAGIMERYTIDFQWLFFLSAILSFMAFMRKIERTEPETNGSVLYKTMKILSISAIVVTALILIPIGMAGEFSRMFQ